MGNCHCKPREGGESVKDFLVRKFHKLSKKRKIDDLVTIAIHETEPDLADGLNEDSLEILDLEDEPLFGDDCAINHMTCQNVSKAPSAREDVLTEVTEESELIRILQKQLREVQSEIANLQKDVADRGQKSVRGDYIDVRHSVRSFQGQEPDAYVRHSASPNHCQMPTVAKNMPGLENNGVGDSTEQESQRSCLLHVNGDVSDRDGPQSELPEKVFVNNRKENASPDVELKPFEKGDLSVKSQQASLNEGRRSRMMGMITEGLRTRSDAKQSRKKAPETTRQALSKKKAAMVSKTSEDASKVAEKIASLQKRNTKLPGPDKGILWPKTMSELSKADKAYYVEHFLRSELFRQRCLRKYQGSKTWMNGLSPFQLWVVEHEGTVEMETVLRPIPKRQNNAQAKVICWRGNTPPPPPKSP